MEDTLRETFELSNEQILCLNPCFNGRYSQRSYERNEQFFSYSLNPCFNGRYSQSACGTLYGIGQS